MLTRDIVYVQGFDFARELAADDWANAEREIAALRAHQKAKRSPRPRAVLGYRGLVVGPAALTADREFAGFWLTDDAGRAHPGLWDFRNASARRFYVDDALRQTNASSADGLFLDTGDAVCMRANLTLLSRQQIFNATALLWRELSEAGSAHGKPFIVTPSLKDHLGADPDGDDGTPMCRPGMPMWQRCAPYGEEVLYAVMGAAAVWAPHRQFNFPSRDFGKDPAGCIAAVQTVIGQGRRGGQMLTCNGCNASSTDGRAMYGSFDIVFWGPSLAHSSARYSTGTLRTPRLACSA